MEYVGKTLRAGQLAPGSLFASVCCERETRESLAQALSCDWGPGLTQLGGPQQKSMALLAGAASADFGDQRWQGTQLLLLPCQAWLGGKWVSGFVCGAVQTEDKQNQKRKQSELWLKWVDGHMAGVSCYVSSGHVTEPRLQYVTAMIGDRLAPPDAGFS